MVVIDGRTTRALLASLGMGAHKGVNIVFGLVTIPLLVGYFGEREYGLAMTLFSLTQWFLLDFGATYGMKMRFIEAHAVGNVHQMRVSFASGCLLSLVLAISVFLIGAASLYAFDWLRFLNAQGSGFIQDVYPTLVLALALICLTIPLLPIRELLTAKQLGYIYSFWMIVGSIAAFAGVLATVWFDLGLVGCIASLCLSNLVAHFAAALAYIRALPKSERPRWQDVSRAEIRWILNKTYFMGLISVSWLVIMNSATIFVNFFAGPEEAAQYYIVTRLFGYLTTLFTFFSFPLWPAIGEARQNRDYAWIVSAIRRICLVCPGLSTLMTTVLAVLAPWLIQLLTQAAITADHGLVLVVAITAAVRMVAETFGTILYGLDRLVYQALLTFLQAIVHVVLCVYLGQHFGLMGVASGVLIALLVTRGVLLPFEVFGWIKKHAS